MEAASNSSPESPGASEIQTLGRYARPEGFIFHFRKNVFIFLDLKVLGALLFQNVPAKPPSQLSCAREPPLTIPVSVCRALAVEKVSTCLHCPAQAATEHMKKGAI